MGWNMCPKHDSTGHFNCVSPGNMLDFALRTLGISSASGGKMVHDLNRSPGCWVENGLRVGGNQNLSGGACSCPRAGSAGCVSAAGADMRVRSWWCQRENREGLARWTECLSAKEAGRVLAPTPRLPCTLSGTGWSSWGPGVWVLERKCSALETPKWRCWEQRRSSSGKHTLGSEGALKGWRQGLPARGPRKWEPGEPAGRGSWERQQNKEPARLERKP